MVVQELLHLELQISKSTSQVRDLLFKSVELARPSGRRALTTMIDCIGQRLGQLGPVMSRDPGNVCREAKRLSGCAPALALSPMSCWLLGPIPPPLFLAPFSGVTISPGSCGPEGPYKALKGLIRPLRAL